MKKYRLYFNRSEDAPQVWSIDEGTTETEINVQKISLNAQAISVYDPKAEYPEPKAWFEVEGTISFADGIAWVGME